MNGSPYRLAIVASHVIQYQDPLFRLIAAQPEIDPDVLYLSTHGATPYRDEDMKTTLRWDVELLRGYRHRFLRNLSDDPNRGWWRHVNPGIVPALIRGHYEAVIFMPGWGSFSCLLGMLACRLAGIPFFLYGDSSFPPPEQTLRARVRARFLRTLFGMAGGFMVSGVLNAAYYQHYGADPSRFFLLPWAVDNERFARAGSLSPEERSRLRERHGIGEDDVAFLFSAKLVERKDPMTLLRAHQRMRHRQQSVVLFLGDGILREPLERYAREHDLDRVRFLGFVNQAEIPRCYALSDVFVLPSTYEPRGAVLNEAMAAAGLPLIVTDRCGSIGDIVLPGENAFVYPAGDAEALASLMDQLTADGTLRRKMAARSRQIIATWDYAKGVEGVLAMLASVRNSGHHGAAETAGERTETGPC
jgi:glycosyltransferase involved in cell wall biosynthesis